MSFLYKQSTGQFLHNGEELAVGYSGNGIYMNNPAMQNIRRHGPLPQGKYTIQQPTVHPHLGPIAMALLPYSTNEMYLRGEFYLHGDNSRGDRSASDGCIILPRDVRVAVAEAVLGGDNELLVVA